MKQLYLDLDGVLADFDKRATDVLGMPGREYEAQFGSEQYWGRLRGTANFYASLELMPGAMDLWMECARSNPIILTGCPAGGWSEAPKRQWVKDKFGIDASRIITCASKDKALHCKPGDILVDDYITYKSLWEEAGGVFITHLNVPDTLRQLRDVHAI